MKKIKTMDLNTMFALVLLLYPVLIEFKYIGMTKVCNIFLVIISTVAVASLWNKKVKLLKYEKLFLLFWLYTILISLVFFICLEHGNFYAELFHIISFIAIVLLFQNSGFDLNCTFKYYCVMVTLFSTITYIQIFLYKIFNIQWRLVPGFYREFEYRASSVFLEPSHYVNYCVFALVILIYIYRSKISLILALFVSGGIIFSNSSSGVLYLALIWGIWLVKNFSIRLFGVKEITIIFILLIAVFFLKKYDILDFAIKHLQETSIFSLSSGSQRLFRGFSVYKNMNIPEQIFGIGGNLRQYITERNIVTIFDGKQALNARDYVSGLSYLLIAGGLVGFFIYIIYYLMCMRKTDYVGKIFLGIYLMYIASNESIYAGMSLLMQLIVFAYLKEEKHLWLSIKKGYKNGDKK